MAPVLTPDSCASLLRQCRSLSEGQRLHAQICSAGWDRSTLIGNLLVQMYGRCRHPANASEAFRRIHHRNVFSWTILLVAYVQNGHLQFARRTFDEMPVKDVVSWTAMVAAYAQVGHLEEARSMFNAMPERDLASWNAMITAYAQNGHGREALFIFRMLISEGCTQPDAITFVSGLRGCGICGKVAEGRIIHACAVESGYHTVVEVGNAIVSMYGKCGSSQEARVAFDSMARNIISWTAMISAYGENGHNNKALEIFGMMDLDGVKPDEIALIAILDACWGSIQALGAGRMIHEDIAANARWRSNLKVGTAILDMYGKCGHLEDARRAFDEMPGHDIVSWTAMITAYARNTQGKEAIALFRSMDLEGVRPNGVTLISALDACASLADLSVGRMIAQEQQPPDDVILETALVNMYAKCGQLEDARRVFDATVHRGDAILWDAIIAAYAQNGHARDALGLYQQVELEGVRPTEVMLKSVLSACSHQGLVDDAYHHLVSMHQDHGLVPTLHHYACIIQLLGRAGELDRAHDLINRMPFEPDTVAWTSLLGACNVHSLEAPT